MKIKNTTNHDFLIKIRQRLSEFVVKVHLSLNSVPVLNYINSMCINMKFKNSYGKSISMGR